MRGYETARQIIAKNRNAVRAMPRSSRRRVARRRGDQGRHRQRRVDPRRSLSYGCRATLSALRAEIRSAGSSGLAATSLAPTCCRPTLTATSDTTFRYVIP